MPISCGQPQSPHPHATEVAPPTGRVDTELQASRDRDAHCHATVVAFVSRQMQGDEFLSCFKRLVDCNDALITDRALLAIRVLCDEYTRAGHSGKGYCVSEEQFRCEIQSLAAEAVRHLP